MVNIGLQLYTVKEETQKDFLGTLRKVGDIGYDGVEFAGYFGVPAAELRRVLDEANLRVAGTHLNTDILTNELEPHIDYCHAIDCPAILCPTFRGVDLDQESTFIDLARFFNKIGQRCKDNRLKFLYHIHGHEFVQLDGKTGMDILIRETDPDLVNFELDTYWVEKGGVDSLAFFRAHGARCPYIHFKDMEDRVDWHDTEVGNGLIDTAGIIREARRFEVDWFVVEQEAFRMPPMESIAVSLRNLRGLADSAG